MYELVGIHLGLGIITFYREIFDGKSTALGHFMSIMQIFGIMYYFKVMIVLMNFGLNHKNMLKFQVIPGYMELGIVPHCIENQEIKYTWAGRATEWFQIEMFMFAAYLGTMVLYMIKSRCILVGINPSKQFDPIYMSLMANKICESINLDHMELQRTKKQTRNRFVNKVRSVDVFYKKIFIKLNKTDFEMIWDKKMKGLKDYVEPKKAIGFIERTNTVKITKDDLDDERV